MSSMSLSFDAGTVILEGRLVLVLLPLTLPTDFALPRLVSELEVSLTWTPLKGSSSTVPGLLDEGDDTLFLCRRNS